MFPTLKTPKLTLLISVPLCACFQSKMSVGGISTPGQHQFIIQVQYNPIDMHTRLMWLAFCCYIISSYGSMWHIYQSPAGLLQWRYCDHSILVSPVCDWSNPDGYGLNKPEPNHLETEQIVHLKNNTWDIVTTNEVVANVWSTNMEMILSWVSYIIVDVFLVWYGYGIGTLTLSSKQYIISKNVWGNKHYSIAIMSALLLSIEYTMLSEDHIAKDAQYFQTLRYK